METGHKDAHRSEIIKTSVTIWFHDAFNKTSCSIHSYDTFNDFNWDLLTQAMSSLLTGQRNGYFSGLSGGG